MAHHKANGNITASIAMLMARFRQGVMAFTYSTIGRLPRAQTGFQHDASQSQGQ